MKTSDLEEKRSIALIPNLTTFIFPISSIGIVFFTLHLFDAGKFMRAGDYVLLISMITIAALGFVPFLLMPYKLYSTRKNFILKKPFGRIEVIAKSEAISVDKFWGISGLYSTQSFGRNLHNNKKVVKFIKRNMNK
jgi:hypothetical protein